MIPYGQDHHVAAGDHQNPNIQQPKPRRHVPRVESYERRRAFSDPDEQYDAYQSRPYQSPPNLNFRPHARIDNFSNAATYGGDTSRGVRFGSSPSQGPAGATTNLNPVRRATIQLDGYSNSSTSSGSPGSRTQQYVPLNSVMAPAAASTQPQAPPFVREAYCPRCLFWLSWTWAEAEAIIKNVRLRDPYSFGLDKQGKDCEGHFRLNSNCCPICHRERHIVETSRDSKEQDILMKQLERILRIWVHGGLIRGMTKEVRKKKESMMPLEELDPRLADDSGHNRADQKELVKKTAHKARDMGLKPGTWQGITFGLLMLSEILAFT